MAIDTEDKRRSVLQFAPFTIPPIADGTIGAQDRAQADYVYSGIVYEPYIPPIITGVWRPIYRPRRR